MADILGTDLNPEYPPTSDEKTLALLAHVLTFVSTLLAPLIIYILKKNDSPFVAEHAKESLQKVAKDRPWLVVLGNEEKGIRRLTEEACDVMCSIPPKGEGVTSLNVSVATGVLLSHLS